ncbi:MAG TPA: ABC transporter [Micrococcales bacterium]|uniref:ABC transporter permease n=1 Tax=Miniimonas arenae TaxID=676201 RepID=A0A5C5BCR0_9MICO|nr:MULTISPECIES: ABC transporter permease [Miniimonas]TNU76024.1 ABC transporter permease [Miniimonas arenae]HCX84953.1 ABC transporter [Micrococcales bacterium]
MSASTGTTTSTNTGTAPSRGRTAHPGGRPGSLATAIRLAPSRIGYEVRGYFRQGDTVFFTFLFPVLMLALFSSIFSGDLSPAGLTGDPANGTDTVSMSTYYLAGMVAAGLLLSGVQNLAIDIAQEKYNGRLKRLGGTPMSPVTYFLGKLGQVFVTGVLQAALTISVGVLAFGASLPTDAGSWLTFAWVFVLGLTGSALLGVALSSVPRSGRSAGAVVIPVVLALQFISGVYVASFQLPESVQHLANLFPLAWLARGMRSVFLPDDFASLELGDSWNLGQGALVLAAWLIVGFVASRLTFRWNRRDA